MTSLAPRRVFAALAIAAVLALAPTSATQISEGTIFGRVTDPSGRAVSGVTVTVNNPELFVKRVVATDSNGEYRVTPVPLGIYFAEFSLFSFRTERFRGRVTDGFPAWQVDAVLPPSTRGLIFGRVTHPSGRVLPGVTVTVTASGSSPLIGKRVVVTNTKGEYRVTPLPLGTYIVEYGLIGFHASRPVGELTAAVPAWQLDVVLPPAPTLLAIIRGDKAGPVLAFVDLAAEKIVTRVPLGSEPHIVDVSADGDFAFVVNTNDDSRTPNAGSISVIDLVTRKEVRRVPTGDASRPHDVRVVGGKVYFAIEGYKSVGRYDPTRNTIDWTIGLGYRGPHMIAVSRDGNTIVGANPGSDNISIVSNALKGPAGWDVTHVPVGRRPEGVDISSDGTEAWVSNEAAGGASIIDLAGKRVVQHLDLKTTHANRLRFTPSGNRVILVDRHTAELVVVDGQNRTLTKKILMPDSAPVSAQNRNRIFDVAASSRRAYVSVNGAQGRSYIGVVDTVRWELIGRIETGATADGMAWIQPK